MLGAGVLVFGLRPRLSPAASYGVVAWSFLVDPLGSLIKGADWLRDSSLFTHMTLAPAANPDWGTAAVIVVLGAAAAGAVVVASTVRSTPSAAPALPAPAAVPVTARGLVQPVRSARVGTLNGGVVRQLNVALDNEVTEQSIVAWVAGPSGTEVVTAPFAGSVTNVLVHAGDTVLPGTVIAIVADTRRLQVETVSADEYVIGRVHVGLPVQVRVDALDSAALTGT